MRLCVLQPPNKSWQRKQSRNRSLGGRKRNQQSQSWQNALAAQVDTRIFLPTKKRRKQDWQKKFTRQLFIFFIYLPFKNTGLKWVFLLLLQAHQKSKYIHTIFSWFLKICLQRMKKQSHYLYLIFISPSPYRNCTATDVFHYNCQKGPCPFVCSTCGSTINLTLKKQVTDNT